MTNQSALWCIEDMIEILEAINKTHKVTQYIQALKYAYTKLGGTQSKKDADIPLPGQIDIEDYIKEISDEC